MRELTKNVRLPIVIIETYVTPEIDNVLRPFPRPKRREGGA
jgi:hypothetical protein